MSGVEDDDLEKGEDAFIWMACSKCGKRMVTARPAPGVTPLAICGNCRGEHDG